MSLSVEISLVRSPSFHASYLLGRGVAAPELAIDAEPPEARFNASWATTRITPRTSSPSLASATVCRRGTWEGETEWLSPRGCAGYRAGITLREVAMASLLLDSDTPGIM